MNPHILPSYGLERTTDVRLTRKSLALNKPTKGDTPLTQSNKKNQNILSKKYDLIQYLESHELFYANLFLIFLVALNN